MIRIADIWNPLLNNFIGTTFYPVINMVIFISPLILMYILWSIFWPLWKDYVQSKYILSVKYTLLEIKLPKDVFKSPLAMEVFLNSIYNASDGSPYDRLWKGSIRPEYSLEMISAQGSVKFLIRTEDKRKSNLMSALYSQFPGIEITEVEDYTKSVNFDPKKLRIWGAEFIFTKPDPFPIKTYVDYKLDKDPKEEYKVDPLVPMIEFLGSLGPEQHVWIQFVIRGHKGDQHKPGTIFGETDLWKDKAVEEINKILIRDPKTKISGKPDKDGNVSPVTITKFEQEVVEALERSITKPAFEVGIRALYIDNKDKFNSGIGGSVGANFKQFGSYEHLNGFKPNGDLWHPSMKGVPWEDPRNETRDSYSKGVLDAYKRRCFFHAPYTSQTIILNTEEIATLFHFPGQVAATPTLNRVPSKKGEAPANLPI